MARRRSNARANAFDDYAKEFQSRLEEANKSYIGEINESSRALLNQLFVVAGGLITLSSPFVITKDILTQLPSHVRIALLINVLLAAISIGCGTVQFYRDIRFLRKRRDINDGIIKGVSDRIIRTLPQLLKASQQQDKAGMRAGSGWMIAQFWLLILAGECFMAVMFYVFIVAKLK